jgi:sulfur carrier protein
VQEDPAAGHRWAAATPARDNAAMDIRLNGESLALPAPCTLTELLAAQGLAERRVAVEVNGEIIPRGRHADHLLADGDVVEIVHALGGG